VICGELHSHCEVHLIFRALWTALARLTVHSAIKGQCATLVACVFVHLALIAAFDRWSTMHH
jgi:hypothetical protein